MTFLAPLWLFLGLLAVGWVLWLRSLRPQQRPRVISSTLLWERVHRRVTETARWRRLVANWLLLLQVLGAAGLALALARPALRLGQAAQSHLILVLDGSASMRATDVAPDRFTAARAQALEVVRTRPAALTSVVLAGPRPQILASQATAPAPVLEAIERAHPADGPADWSRAADLVRSLLETGNHTRLVLFTDGAFDTEAASPLLRLAERVPLEARVVGSAAPNVGITGFTARPVTSALGDYQVLLSLLNGGTQPTQVTVRLENGDGVWHRERVSLAPGQSRNLLLRYRYRGAEVLTAALELGEQPDALAADNSARLVFGAPTPTRVLLVGPGNYYLQRGLQIFPGVIVVTQPAGARPDLASYHLVIFDRTAPPPLELLAGRTLVTVAAPLPPGSPSVSASDTAGRANGTGTGHGPATSSLGAGGGGEMHRFSRPPQVTWWSRAHPLARYVSWEDVRVETQQLFVPASDEQVLVETEAGPLVTVRDTGEVRWVRLAFDLTRSDFPLRVAFPVFLENLIEWANPEGWSVARPPLRAAEPFAITVRAEEGRRPEVVTVEGPTGRLRLPVRGGVATLDQTHAAGLYRLSAGKQTWSVAVNVADAEETNLTPRANLPRTALPPPIPADARQRLTSRPFWWPLAFVAFLALSLESWLYVRRGRLAGAQAGLRPPAATSPEAGPAPRPGALAAAWRRSLPWAQRASPGPTVTFLGAGLPGGARRPATTEPPAATPAGGAPATPMAAAEPTEPAQAAGGEQA